MFAIRRPVVTVTDMNDIPEPSIRLTPAVLDKIEEDQPLTLLSHTDAWSRWPARWKALRDLIRRATEGDESNE